MSIESLPATDHDILITLHANFKTFTDQYHLDMQEIKDSTSIRLADHEIRIHKMEEVVSETKPVETVKEFRILQKQVNDFIVSAKTARFFVGIITAILGSAFTLAANSFLKNWGIIK